jgi:hypothetical protein
VLDTMVYSLAPRKHSPGMASDDGVVAHVVLGSPEIHTCGIAESLDSGVLELSCP